MATTNFARIADCSVASTASTAAAVDPPGPSVDAIASPPVDAPGPAVDAIASPPVDAPSPAVDAIRCPAMDSSASDSPVDTSHFVATSAVSGNVAFDVPDTALTAEGG